MREEPSLRNQSGKSRSRRARRNRFRQDNRGAVRRGMRHGGVFQCPVSLHGSGSAKILEGRLADAGKMVIRHCGVIRSTRLYSQV